MHIESSLLIGDEPEKAADESKGDQTKVETASPTTTGKAAEPLPVVAAEAQLPKQSPFAPLIQMRNDKVEKHGEVLVRQVTEGFIRDAEGRIFYCKRLRENEPPKVYVVRADGRYSKRHVVPNTPTPDTKVDRMRGWDLGIDKIRESR